VLEGLRGEDSISELCRREGIAQNLYYRWSKDFLEAGKKRLAGDTARAATSDEVKDLRRESTALKEAVADLTLENRPLKKRHDSGWGGRRMRYPASEKLEIIRVYGYVRCVGSVLRGASATIVSQFKTFRHHVRARLGARAASRQHAADVAQIDPRIRVFQRCRRETRQGVGEAVNVRKPRQRARRGRDAEGEQASA
jgi:transposase-like protein